MLTESARMLWRRRIWVAVALLLAAAAGIGAYAAIKPGQESKAQVLFLGSIKQPGVSGPTNPFVNLGNSLAITASVVQQGVTSDQTAQQLFKAGNEAAYTVEPNLAENAGPVLLVTVDDTSAAMVEKTLKGVLSAITAQLKTLQVDQHVPRDLFITAQTFTQSPHPAAVHKAQTQKAVIAFLAVLVILVATILLVERFRVSRRAKRAAAPEPEPTVARGDTRSPRSVTSPPVALPASRARLRGSTRRLGAGNAPSDTSRP